MSAAILAVLVSLAGIARAAFEPTGAGARGPALGDALVAGCDDTACAYYNPAGLSTLDRPELSTAYSRLLLGLSDGSSIDSSFFGYAHPLAGGRGTPALSWRRLSLDSYSEDVFAASFARRAAEVGSGALHAGGSLKYLRRSFGAFPEATNALNGLAATGTPDPVLSGSHAKGAPSLDVGALYVFRQHYAVGAAVSDVFEPNVAFAGGDDRVARRGSVGLGYRSSLSALLAQLDARRGPTGAVDQRFAMAAERWISRALLGDFSLRASLAVGSRGQKQLGTGLGYRTRRLGVDYAFVLPIGGLSSSGSHRMGLSFRFGPLAAPDEAREEVLAAMSELKRRRATEITVSSATAPSDTLEEHLAFASALISQGQYSAGLERMRQAVALAPGDRAVFDRFARLNFVARMIPTLQRFRVDPAEASLHESVLAYLGGDAASAVARAAYAVSLAPKDAAAATYLSELEATTGVARPADAPVAKENSEARRLALEADAAIEERRYEKAADRARAALRLDDGLRGAWESLGIALYALGRYDESTEAWRGAYRAEKDPARKALLRGYLESAERMARKPSSEKPRPAAPRISAEEARRLYTRGVENYVGGRLEQARRDFEDLLSADPENAPARRALRRVIEEQEPKP